MSSGTSKLANDSLASSEANTRIRRDEGMGMLNEQAARQKILDGLARVDFAQQKVLAIIPDRTRTCPMPLLFQTVVDALRSRVKQLDFMIALGTHPAMSVSAIQQWVGISAEDAKTRYRSIQFFNHEWNNRDALQQIGTLSAEEIGQLTGGLMREDVDVSINRHVFAYDRLLMIGPTFPHEVVGFSGGNKYLFPGISGPDVLNMFHWLGALITNAEIIGTEDTAVRRVINRAAAMVAIPKTMISLVVSKAGLHDLFIDTPEAAYAKAAALSSRIHIRTVQKPFNTVLSLAPTMYADIWTAGKCMYKLERVVADGGELIIYAPHIQDVSVIHGETIEAIGYHVRDYFVKQWDRFKHIPRGVLAHSTHVRGAGNFENGVERPRIGVTLATRIPAEICRAINLGYRDPDQINVAAWEGQEDEGVLVVPNAGEVLYTIAR